MADNIDIVVRDSGVEVVVRDLRSIGGAARESKGDVDILSSALKAMGAYLAIDKIQHWADAWNSAAGLINVTSSSTNQAAAIMDRLYGVAQKTRQPLGDIATLYNRAALASSQLGASNEDLIKFTKGVSESLVIQHTTAQQASGALLQLGQLLGMNTIRAQEYNSLLQNGVVILQTVAKHMKGTGGTVAGLTNMVKGGKVPVKEFFDAFLQGSNDLEASFAKSSFLFSQGWNIINNGMAKYIGQLDDALGVSKSFAQFAQWFAENLPAIAAGVAAIGAAIAVAFAPGIIESFIAQLTKLAVLVYANPFTALIAGAAALITYIYMYGDSINAGIDATTSLKDVGRALIEELQGAWQGFVDFLGGVWSGITDAATAAWAAISTNGKEEIQSLGQDYSDFYSTQRTGFAAFATYVAKTIDAIAGLLVGIGHAIVNVFTGLPTLFGNIFDNVYNAVVKRVQDMVNASIDAINTIGSLVGRTLVDHIQLQTKNVDKDYWKKYGQGIADGIDQGFADQGGFMQKQLDTVLARAKQIGDARTAAGRRPAEDLSGRPAAVTLGPTAAELAKQEKALERLKKQLAGVIGEISPADAAERKLAEAQDILTRAVGKHLITQERANEVMAQLRQRYQDQLDPIGAVVRKLQEQAIAYQYVGDKQTQVQQMTQIEEELRKKNISLTEAQRQGIIGLIAATQELMRINQLENQVLNQTVYAQRQQIEQATAIANLKQLGPGNGGISGGQAAQATTSALNNSGLNMQNTAEQQAAYLESYRNLYAQIDEYRKNDLISEQTAAALKLQADNQYLQNRLQTAQTFLGGLAVLQNTHSKKAFAIGKAAAIAQAVINTYQSATGAYAAMASIPYVGPFLGVAAAAAAIAAGIANVSKIKSQQMPAYRTGGSMIVGGNGGPDSQMIGFRATPGEQITINTPSQARAIERGNNQDQPRQTYVKQDVNLVVQGRVDRRTRDQLARDQRRAAQREYSRSSSTVKS